MPRLRTLAEMAAAAATFAGTVLLVQALADEDSLPRRVLSAWADHLRDRRAFAQAVRDTIARLPIKEG